jgi:cytochrome c oxidase subunit 3
MAQGARLVHTQSERPFMGMDAPKLGMWIFLLTEVIFFGGIIAASLILRKNIGEPWLAIHEALNIPLTAFNTFVLIISSVTLVIALAAIQEGKQDRFKLFWVLTIILGAFFLGVQAYEYNELWHHGLNFSTTWGSAFYFLTGFHGFHVFMGVIMLMMVAYKGFQNGFSPHEWGAVERVGLYWHFVDLVWIIVFTIVYLL